MNSCSCGAAPGELHRDMCDVERCPRCGCQYISCGHETTARRIPWSGEWPGVDQCREWGWYAYLHPGTGWIACAPDREGATEDLNRLYRECRWNATAQKWERRQ